MHSWVKSGWLGGYARTSTSQREMENELTTVVYFSVTSMNQEHLVITQASPTREPRII